MSVSIRKASGAVVFGGQVIHGGDTTGLRILLVKSTNGGQWVYPKGGVEDHLSKRGNAVKEVYEEAGVIGVIGDRITQFEFIKNDVRQVVTMFTMVACHQLDDYPEAAIRERAWFSIEGAFEVLSEQHRIVLEGAMRCMRKQGIKKSAFDMGVGADIYA